VLAALAALQVPADTPPERQPYLEVRVRLDAPEPGLRAAIETAIEGKPLRLAKIDTRFVAQPGSAAETVVLAELENLQPDDIFERLYQQKYQTDAPAPLRSAFTELMLINETSAEVSA
jgi:exonuclease SbcD